MESKKNYSSSLGREYDEPKFLNPEELSYEQLTDPDYSIKKLKKMNKGKLEITCSKCHHCR